MPLHHLKQGGRYLAVAAVDRRDRVGAFQRPREPREIAGGEHQHVDVVAHDGELDVIPGRYVSISVADTGEGMPINIALAAPDPFFTPKAPEQGTGLGLAIVIGAVRAAGGALLIDSEVAIGTEVTVLLPEAQAAE